MSDRERILLVVLTIIFSTLLALSFSSYAATKTFTKHVDSRQCSWQSTGIKVTAGDVLKFHATGQVVHWKSADGTQKKYCGPDGSGPGACSGPEPCCLAPGLGDNALVGKIGSGSPFYIGSNKTITAGGSGILYLGMNETVHCGGCADNEGSWTVYIEQTVSAPSLACSPSTLDFGASSTIKTFSVWNNDGGTLTYAIRDNSEWIRVSPTSGSSTGKHDVNTITVRVDRSELTEGRHTGKVIINSNGGTHTVRVDVEILPATSAALPSTSPSTPAAGRGTPNVDNALYQLKTAMSIADNVAKIVEVPELSQRLHQWATRIEGIHNAAGIARTVSTLKELAERLQESKRKNDILEESKIYSEFLRSLTELERSLVKETPAIAEITGSSVGGLAASAFSAAVTPALLVNYVQVSVLGSWLEKNAVEVQAALYSVKGIKEPWKQEVARDLSAYNLGNELSNHVHAVVFHYKKPGLFGLWQEEASDNRKYGIYQRVGWDYQDKALKIEVVFWTSKAAVDSPKNSLHISVSVAYDNKQEVKVVTDQDILATAGGKALTIYEWQLSIPWKAKYGKPQSIKIAYRVPGALQQGTITTFESPL